MDLGTVIGIIGALGLVISAMAMGVGIGPYIDVQSVLIVVLGSFMILFIGFKTEQMKKFGKVFMIAIKPTYQPNFPEIIRRMVEYSTIARRDGLLALEDPLDEEPDPFLKRGLMLAVDGNEPDTVRTLLEAEVGQIEARHKAMASIFDTWAAIAGAMGMIGTLVGLVAMLLNMADPSAIGPAMAVALLTTLYGSLIGNVFGVPIANKLGLRNADEVLAKNMIIEGIMSIQAGDNPRTLENKLFSFLPPSQRKSQFD